MTLESSTWAFAWGSLPSQGSGRRPSSLPPLPFLPLQLGRSREEEEGLELPPSQQIEFLSSVIFAIKSQRVVLETT